MHPPFEKLSTFDLSYIGLNLTTIPRELWNRDTWRQSYEGTAHSDTQAIYLRMPKRINATSLRNDLEAHPCHEVLKDMWKTCPEVTHALTELMMQIQDVLKCDHGMTRLGRAMLVRLKAGGRVTPHVDQGAYAEVHRRVHVPLKSEAGNFMVCDGVQQVFQEGELWRFNHRALHSAVNASTEDRVHLILDYV